MIAIHTDCPLLPLTQMIGGDGLIEEGGDLDRIVLMDDDMVGAFAAMTLEILGHETLVHQVVPR
jgi:hypothetical protein